MDIGLKGRVALITGGSRGIGEAIAKAFAFNGVSVVIVARKEESLRRCAEQINQSVGEQRVVWIAANVTDGEGLARTQDFCRERFGFVDILVNGAATNPHFGPLVETDGPAAKKIWEVNVDAPQRWISAFWKDFWANSEMGVSCINIASVGGMVTEAGIGLYNVSKAALIHLTKQYASELGPRVRVNSISPGLVRTDFARALWEASESRLADTLPLGRIGEPEDISGAALYLASDLSSWVTGTNIVVDGGALARNVGLGESLS